jgi:hypothetical protein
LACVYTDDHHILYRGAVFGAAAVISAVPLPRTVTVPFASTLATLLLEEAHDTIEESASFTVVLSVLLTGRQG